jgi:hypothetical protein
MNKTSIAFLGTLVISAFLLLSTRGDDDPKSDKKKDPRIAVGAEEFRAIAAEYNDCTDALILCPYAYESKKLTETHFEFRVSYTIVGVIKGQREFGQKIVVVFAAEVPFDAPELGTLRICITNSDPKTMELQDAKSRIYTRELEQKLRKLNAGKRRQK